ncbi:uncharacterized protein LOC128181350 [Crassostrea angulata]|uniref:uncharacterized protein LOC128181350 n=1 Tax=Magallana angulata TaxID=2784310 RepID=UPI0022B1CAEB|nr:uncharacterized protein LOC128181350 [Crassostrea angulata]
MDISSKALIHYNEKLRREYEIVSLFVKRIVVSNAKPGETSISRLIEPKPLQGVTSNNGGDYIVKKSLSDGIIETGSCTQIIKANGHQRAEVKDDYHIFDINNNQNRKQSESSAKKQSLIQNGSANGDKGDNERICRELDLEAHAARRKQIEVFFTDPVDREMFPLNPPEIPTSRTYRPIEVPLNSTAEESISIMLAKYSAALRDKDFMREVYEYRRLPRPPARGMAPLSYEWLTLNTYSGLMQSTEQQTPGDSQVNANAQQRFEIEIIDNQGMKKSDPSFSVDEEEKNKHRTSWFVRLFCYGANSIPKKVRQENGEKSKGFLSRLRKVFGKK